MGHSPPNHGDCGTDTASKRSSHTRTISKIMAVCVLDKEETRKLESHNTRPNCCHHHHLRHSEVVGLVRSGEMRWVVDGRRATYNAPLVWAVVNSGGFDVLQMVDQ